MFDLQGGMWHLQGQIVQFQQTIAASGAVGSLSQSAATQTSLPTQEQPEVSSEGAQVQAHQTTDSQVATTNNFISKLAATPHRGFWGHLS